MSTLRMTLSGPRLHQPSQVEADGPLAYGTGFCMQISPTEVALLVNLRQTGAAVTDFENGWDVLVLDDLSQIRPERAVKGLRNTPATHPRTGRELTMVHHLPTGGFVPLGAKLTDGTPHPHAGTGFGVAVIHGYPADNSDPHAHVAADLYQYRQVVQFRYDGEKFEIAGVDNLGMDEILPGWHVYNRALGPAIADGEDLLFGLVAGRLDEQAQEHQQRLEKSGRKPHPHAEFPAGECYGSGLSRWRYGNDGWKPVDFVPIPERAPDMASEPSAIRDGDGSLLFCVRGKDSKAPPGEKSEGLENTFHHFRVYRSSDNGTSWESVIHQPLMRAASPVSIFQTTSGQPVLAANPYRAAQTDSKGRPIYIMRLRDHLWLWPLSADRRDVHEPYRVLDVSEVLGPPRPIEARNHDNIWYADHPVGGLFRLRDEQWHCLLSFRLTDAAITSGGALPAPEAGVWVEEVFDEESGEPVLPWRF